MSTTSRTIKFVSLLILVGLTVFITLCLVACGDNITRTNEQDEPVPPPIVDDGKPPEPDGVFPGDGDEDEDEDEPGEEYVCTDWDGDEYPECPDDPDGTKASCMFGLANGHSEECLPPKGRCDYWHWCYADRCGTWAVCK